MNLIKKIILLLFISLSIFSLPIITLADGLVPCGLDSTYDNRCTLCHLFKGIENIVDWGKDILVVVALVALVAGAIMYIVSAGNNGMMESAKNVIKQALWGVVIVLGAWVIVNTSLWLIATESDLGVGVSNWYTFDCEGGGGGGDDDTDTGNVSVDSYEPSTPGVCSDGFTWDADSDRCKKDKISCTSFTYSDWGACQSNNTQTRTVTSRIPANCEGTPDSLRRNCTSEEDTCTSFTYSSWTPDPCTAGSTQTRTATGVPSGCTGGTPESISRSCSTTPSTNDADEDATRDKLDAAGVDVNVDKCCYGNGCTCVGGLRDETVDGIIDFKKDCDSAIGSAGGGSCNVTISGGSEDGVHSEGTTGFNHENGYKIDIRTDPTVNAYIKNNFEKIDTLRSDGAQGYTDPDTGATYYLEGNHWDITYNSQG